MRRIEAEEIGVWPEPFHLCDALWKAAPVVDVPRRTTGTRDDRSRWVPHINCLPTGGMVELRTDDCGDPWLCFGGRTELRRRAGEPFPVLGLGSNQADALG